MHSIFNDILGPVMAGPSSSHSAGCARIGRAASLLWGKPVKKAVVIYDEQGSYPETCVGQGSNFGFTGGLLGMKTDDPSIKYSERIAKERNVDISFKTEKLSASHPNEARVEIYDADKPGMSLLTFSVGGGMFKITEMDGFPLYIDGSKELLFVCSDIKNADILKSHAEKHALSVKIVSGEHDKMLICCESISDMDNMVSELKGIEGIEYIRRLPVILPMVARTDSSPVFTNAADALKYAKITGRNLWQLGLDYELSVADTDEAGVMAEAEYIHKAMKNAAVPPDAYAEKYGFLPYRCAEMMNSSAPTVNTGWLNKAMFYAIAVMENSCAHNIVTASPTAGSSGVIPAAIVAIGEEMRKTDEEIRHALLAAGLVGSFIANNATFAAETAGCQAENGSASAMAACGIVQLLGGTVQQGFMAASLALQNVLGLICDPIGGLTEIPCISRNVMAMSNAVMAANMVMLGFDPVIPLDETISAMMDVGRMMHSDLRCTCRGGLCAVPTGKAASCINKTNQ